MTSALFAPVCSIAPTRRRRFLWAAWWTAAPTRHPFRKPDAFAGGTRTRDEALREAERAAGSALLEIEAGWARAWANVLVGGEPWPREGARDGAARAALPGTRGTPANSSVWETLGLKSDATVLEIKRAYRARALSAHPDRGGSAESFRALQAAYETALTRRARAALKPKSKSKSKSKSR